MRGHREVTVAVDLLMYLAADATAQVLVQPGSGSEWEPAAAPAGGPGNPAAAGGSACGAVILYFKPFSAFDNDRRSATRKATPKALPPGKLFTTHSLRSLKPFRPDHCAFAALCRSDLQREKGPKKCWQIRRVGTDVDLDGCINRPSF